mgnify:CR=1 FL=1
MLRISEKYEAPVDYQLYPLVRYLHKKGLWVGGWDFNMLREDYAFINVLKNKKIVVLSGNKISFIIPK